MGLVVSEANVKSVLTRSSGYLRTVCSHSLQPYRGCSFGRSLCGVGCYVQHNPWLRRGAAWGAFLEARTNAADAYRAQVERERAWARREREGFAIFFSSATDPFVPQEAKLGVSARVLEAMAEAPPDTLIVQTHSASVTDHLPALVRLAACCDLRVQLSIETDRERLPGLPSPASSVSARFAAAAELRAAGIRTVVTVSPLLPIEDPRAFFTRVREVSDAVVVDHYIGGDGSADGSRTARTPLPAAMEALHPGSTTLAYRDEVVAIARDVLPGRVGVGPDGFAGRYA
jgi:DNA repair photolyase